MVGEPRLEHPQHDARASQRWTYPNNELRQQEYDDLHAAIKRARAGCSCWRNSRSEHNAETGLCSPMPRPPGCRT